MGDYYLSAYPRPERPGEKRELKTINTDEIDTSGEKKATGRQYAIPGEITRDTTLNLPRGKTVVRMVTQKPKESPYLAILLSHDRDSDPKQLTLGQRLALKHQIREKPRPKPPTPPPTPPPPPPAETAAKGEDSGDGSDWTWETCSSSEAEAENVPAAVVASPPVAKKKTPSPPIRRSRYLNSKASETTTGSHSKTPPSRSPPKSPPIVSSILAQARAITQKYTRSNTTALCVGLEDTRNSPQKPASPPLTGLSTVVAPQRTMAGAASSKWMEAANADTKIREGSFLMLQATNYQQEFVYNSPHSYFLFPVG
jgi:hypothetical protein